MSGSGDDGYATDALALAVEVAAHHQYASTLEIAWHRLPGAPEVWVEVYTVCRSVVVLRCEPLEPAS